MEKKIEERLKRIESYLRQADKGTQFAEACSIAQEALYDLKIAISKQPTPSSLPTDEDFEIEAILYNFQKGVMTVQETREELKSLRTNFSSEKYTIDKFIVFCTSEDHEDDVAQLSIPFNTYEEAENFKNSDYHKKAYPNAYILCTTIPNPLKQNG